ncbi:MAG: hypothetical protein ABIO70_20535 [Pseudomonadota bacterium]
MAPSPRTSVGLTALLALATVGCQRVELSASWTVDRLRVLAVRAEPAEPAPGDTVGFEALIVSPDAPLQLVMWLACPADIAGVMGCELDPAVLEQLAGLDPESLSPEELAALYAALADAGLMGAEPYLPPSWTVPDHILDGLTEAERNEGVTLFVQVSAIPEGAEGDSDLELAYKRFPISEAATPNHNPVIDHLLVDGAEVAAGVILELDPLQAYEIEPVLADDAVETYRYLLEDGTWEERLEEPYFSIYVQEGDISASNTLYPYSSFTWTTPEAPALADQTLWIVLQDRRGGMSWWSQQVRFR